MKVSEAIEKLTVKRDDALHFQKLYRAGDVGWSANESKAIAYSTAINVLEQLDEPQAENVEVSQEFADWVEKAMVYQVMTKEWCLKEITNMGWGDWLHDPQNGEKYPCDDHWSCEVYGNKEKHIKAIYDGYTVKPKRWVVKFKQQNEQFYFIGWMNSYSTLPAGYGDKEADNVIKFTDRAKAEAVATLVDGTVEEV